MRMLMTAKMSTADFNNCLKSGNVSKIINRIIEDTKPEAAYFGAEDGCRTAYLIVNFDDPSAIPRFAEPWFINFNASIDFKPVMTTDDLRKAAVDDLGRKWG